METTNFTSGPTAVRLFASDHPALARTVKARLERRRLELIEQLTGAQDWADYKHRIGVIEGLREAAMHCDDVHKELEGN